MLRRMARSSVSVSPVAAANGHAPLPVTEVRNPGLPLDLDWVHEARYTNRSATERRAATLPTRRSVKKAWQAAWLLRAITCIDLTTLQGDDTPGTVRRLCAKARQPVRQDILDSLGIGDLPITVGAVCVYHNLVETAVEALAGSGIPVAAVSTGFPAGQTPFETKLAEIRASVAAGAHEIDIVISRAHEDDHRHRRAGHAAQRPRGEPGVHDGGRRFHQDVDRQGADQRHPAGQP